MELNKKSMKFKQNNLLSRRNFVKSTTLATTGILSATIPVAAMANVNGNKKLKLALVGCGGRGTGAIVQALQADENTELVAMADSFQDRVEKSLKAVQEHFDGVMKIKIKPKNLFSGLTHTRKQLTWLTLLFLQHLQDLDLIILSMQLKMESMYSWKNQLPLTLLV